MKIITTTNARKQIAKLVESVRETGDVYAIGRRNKPEVLLMKFPTEYNKEINDITNINIYSKSFAFLDDESEFYTVNDLKKSMYKKGTIVLVPFPFTDLTGSKVRPAVIISKGKIGNDVVVVFITSQNKLKIKHCINLLPNEINNLKVKSKIVCSKIATLETKIVLGELGCLSEAEQKNLDFELKKILTF